MSLALLAAAFAVGIATADYSAFSAGVAPAGSRVTVLIVCLLAAGVYGWYRIVKTTAELHDWKNREFRLSDRSLALETYRDNFGSKH